MKSRHCLIVDDSKSARFSLTKLLERLGHKVDSAASGDDALAFLQRAIPGKTVPDIILMDHLMPGLDGFQTTHRIKADPSVAHVPVVMCTSKEGKDYVKEAAAIGAIGLLPKPASKQQVVQMFKQLDAMEVRQRKTAETYQAETTTSIARKTAKAVVDERWHQLQRSLQEDTLALSAKAMNEQLQAFKLETTQNALLKTDASLTEDEIKSMVGNQVDSAVQESLEQFERKTSKYLDTFKAEFRQQIADPDLLHDALMDEAKSAAEFTATHRALETSKRVSKETTQQELSDQMRRLYLPQIEQHIYDFLAIQQKRIHHIQIMAGASCILSTLAVLVSLFLS